MRRLHKLVATVKNDSKGELHETQYISILAIQVCSLCLLVHPKVERETPSSSLLIQIGGKPKSLVTRILVDQMVA